MRLSLIPLLLGIVLLCAPFQAAVAVPPFGTYDGASFSPTITVLEDNASRVRLRLEMLNLPGGSINFSNRLPGLWENMNVSLENGGHLLPRFSIMVALPNTGNPTAVIEEWNSQSYATTPISLGENTPGQPRVVVGAVGIMGGVRLVPVTIKPILYTNNAAVCSVMTSATVSIELDDQQGDNHLDSSGTAFSRSWQKVLQATVTNWDYIPNFYNGALSHMLLVVPDAYISSLAEFIRWKEQRGMKVTVVPKSSIGSNPTSDQIRARIISEVNASSPHIDYVCLVGDETQLAASMIYTPDTDTRFSWGDTFPGSYTNEGVYCAIEGTDVFPDVFLGRWSVNSATETANVAAHEVVHERDTFSADSARFEKATVSSDYTVATQRITKRQVAHQLADHGFTYVDSIWGNGSGAQPMINAITQGRTFVNYRGSGWNNWWYGLPFFISDIQYCNNPRKLTIITGIGCGVAKFDSQEGDCFGEMWMLSGTPSQPKGTAGFIGPCWNTHTVFNDCLDSLLYRSFLEYGVQNLMPALVSGKMMEWALMADFLDESPVVEVMNTLFRQYLVLSDPSLQVFTDTPKRLQVTAADAIPGGLVNYTVTVDNMDQVAADSILVTAWFDSTASVSGWIPQGSSSTTLALNSQGADTMVLTITGDNVLAFQQGVSVSAVGPYISHISADLNETNGNGDHFINPGETLNWTEAARNIGTESALNVTATLSSSTPGVTVVQNAVAFGTIDTQQTVTASTPFVFSVAPSDTVGPALQFNVVYSMSNGASQQAPLTLYVHIPNVQLGNVQVADSNNGFWDRNETVSLQIAVTNSGNADLLGATYTLTTQDPLVTIVDGIATAPLIPDSGGTYTFAADSFVVHSSWLTPAGHATTLLFTVTSNMGTYTYSRTMPINLVIGVVGSSDPFADTAGHFWIYDNSDSLYTEHPTYDWMEIAPPAGGAGTEIPYTSGDQTYPLHLPFSYTYYGVTKDSLSVSTDGWVRPGRTTATDHTNTALPNSADNVPGMIAPLWFDLRRPVGETGEVCYYYDSSSDRFIVEWYQIHHPGANDSVFETFQVQLLNPATYPTQSGDAIWIFQYQETSALVNGSTGGATVGFESPSQTDGATYVFHGAYATGAATVQAGRAIKLTTEPPAILGAPPRHAELPKSVELRANYPNPFNPETTIEFALPRADHVTLSVFDVLGRQVATLIDGQVEAGVHTARWRGILDSGASATSGVYFYRLVTSGQATTRKMVLLR